MLIAFFAAAAATVPKATAIDPVSWFSPDDYPMEAAKKGIEGNATFEVDVDAEGKPTACRITDSSGSASLDQTTCDIVLKKGRFKPAMFHGKAVAGRYSETASWRLEGVAYATAIDPALWFSADDYPIEAAKKGAEGTATFEVDVDPQGEPVACRITRSSGSAALDQKTCEVVLKNGRFEPAMSGGKPVAGRYSRTASWRLEGLPDRSIVGAKCKRGETAAEVHGCV
jgi:TonB family protein